MRLQRFIAADARQAIRQVNQELGADALILSNRRVADGVEIIAAMDYEDELLGADRSKKEMPDRSGSAVEDTVVPEGDPATRGNNAAAGQRRDSSADRSVQQMREEIGTLRSMLEAPLSQLAWADMERRQPLRAALLKRLMSLGLHPVVANRVADQVWEIQDLEQGWRNSLAVLGGMIPVEHDDLTSDGGTFALLGPTGVGKTTTVAKLAARCALRHGRRHVALVTMDCYRVGAHDQLRTYGRLLGIPVHVASDREELNMVLNHVSDRKLVLIDTAGTGQRDARLAEQFEALDLPSKPIRNYLVLSATGQTVLHDEVVRAFRPVEPHGCILTKVDEATSIGGAISVLIKEKLPMCYITDGQRVPDDIHKATVKKLIKHAVELVSQCDAAQSDSAWVQALGAVESRSPGVPANA